MDLAVIDLETTSVSAESGRIVEIAIVRTRGLDEIARWSSLVRSEVPVGASERVHHLSDAMLADAPTLASLRAEIATRLAGAALVAHRAPFDLGFLDAAIARGELAERPTTVIDTAAIAERVLGDSRLSSVATRIGGRAPAHRAMPDALAALDALAACVETLGPVDAAELAELSETRASMRRGVREPLGEALERGLPLGIVYRPASGRLWRDALRVEHLRPPYVTGMFENKRVRKDLRGDRILRAYTGEPPTLRFL